MNEWIPQIYFPTDLGMAKEGEGKGGVVVNVDWQHDRIWNQEEKVHLGMPVEGGCDYINWGGKTHLLAGILNGINTGNWVACILSSLNVSSL